MLVTTAAVPELADPTTPNGLLVWTIALAVIIVVVTVVGLAVRTVVKWAPTARKVAHFVDDVAGEPERPGVPARPGLMERMSQLEQRVVDVQKQVNPNHGSSVPDKVADLSERLDKHITESEPIRQQVADLHEQFYKHDKETP